MKQKKKKLFERLLFADCKYLRLVVGLANSEKYALSVNIFSINFRVRRERNDSNYNISNSPDSFRIHFALLHVALLDDSTTIKHWGNGQIACFTMSR